ncbi:MAG: C-terminal binding protein, partial [Acidobacteria bacterium]|nr:C-terminal binding protein [Acidobacteriota bacterium]
MTPRGGMRKILVTDYAWADLEEERRILAEAGAELVVAARGDEAELCALAPPVEGILTCWKQVSARVLDSAPGCLSVHRYGIGLDNIDVARATALGMVVTNVPAYCLEEVSDHAMGLMLALSRKIAFYDRQAKSGVYDLAAGAPLYRLSGKTLGLFGAGKIGRTLARKAAAFGMKIIAHDVVPVASPGIEPVSFDDLLARSDFISIHAPLTPDTRRLFWTEIFRKMKPGAFLINTARGEIVDTGALSA